MGPPAEFGPKWYPSVLRVPSEASCSGRFIYVDEFGCLPQASRHQGLIPSNRPNLSSELTHVWLTTTVAFAEDHILWSVDAMTGWEDVGVIAVA
jgi:hypothetical protein